jgi:alkylation response protein AidB-like acyl-CoA dehydrogenase
MSAVPDAVSRLSQPGVLAAAAERFLSQNAVPRADDGPTFAWGGGDDGDVAIWEEPDYESEQRHLSASRRWRAQRFDAGLGWLDGPAKYGGGGLSPEAVRQYQVIESHYSIPDQSFFKLDRVLVPILLRYGTETVRTSFLRSLFRGDTIGCELFSEPDAGSDLASARTSATLNETEWILNGQKIWTSDAHYADIGVALCRTDPATRRHESLTAFVVDMHHPGVEVRPLRQMTGGSSFNEVFLTDVPVQDSHRLGDIGQGWEIVQATLKIERAAIGLGLGRGGAGLANGRRVVEMAKHLGLASDPLIRQRIAEVYTGFRLAKYLGLIARAEQLAGGQPGPAPLLAKLCLTRNTRALSELVRLMLGQRLAADTGEWGTFAWGAFVLGEPGLHITAGTDEILRNIVAAKVLGLPRD